MQFLAVLLTLALAAAPVFSKIQRCGTVVSADQMKSAEAHFKANRIDPKQAKTGAALAAVIEINWHVISKGNTPEQGNLADTSIRGQIDVLNEDYTGSGISFVLRNTTRTTNADWFSTAALNNAQNNAMKKATHTGTKKTLNIWSVGFENGEGSGLLGYSTYPWYLPNMDLWLDGVVIRYSSLPGGSLVPYNLGATATHEVGHWLGLYHTFDGGCDGDGDFVSDTPAEANPVFGCPAKAGDSCPKSPGVDNIHNYMDYTDDNCMTGFTPGQIFRMKSQIATYRGINA